jgi:TonB-linked SusC/RagA family outer membrane protein
MKRFLIFFLVLISFASTKSNAQKRLTFNVKNAPVTEIMSIIFEQANYSYIGNPIMMLLAKSVTLNASNMSIEDVLDLVVCNQPFTYKIRGRIILFIPRPKDNPESSQIFVQQTSLHGTIVDFDNKPLNKAIVYLKGTEKSKSCTTNIKGEFNLSDVPKKGILIIKYMDYEVISFPYEGYTILNIRLNPQPSQLNETVINAQSIEPFWKGYYSTTQGLNTGSIGLLKETAIANKPTSNLLIALNGKITGLYAAQSSGIPGAHVKVNIQGLNSINGGNAPLYIVDRVPFSNTTLSQTENASGGLTPLAVIDPGDIESINVLKGADATAIYGSRGANGVILITTKKGKAGKTKIDVTISSGIGMVAKKLNLMNADQYLVMRKEAFKNDFTAPGILDYDLNGKWDTSKNTDWQKLLIGGLSNFTNAKVTLSGGNTNTQFLFGTSYKHETTVFPGEFASNTGTVNLSIQHSSKNKKFKVSNSTMGNYNSNRLPRTDLTQSILMAPIAPGIHNNGQLNWEKNYFNNPLGTLLQSSDNITQNVLSNINLSYKLLPDLNIETNVGYNRISLKDQTLIPSLSVMPSSADPSEQRMSSKGINTMQTWIIEPQLTYKANYRKHTVDLLLGTTFQENRKKGSLLSGWGFENDSMLRNTSSARILDSTPTYTQYRYNAIYARMGYNYMEKYVLNLTSRIDGSSRFGAGQNFGVFWSVGGAWIFSNENFFKERFKCLSLGKIRGSIGKTGNDQIPDYQYLSIYEPAPGYFGSAGLAPTLLSNPNFFWETIKKSELALELAFYDRGAVTVGLFRNRTINQLLSHTLPATTGFITVTENLPVIIENKGLEAEAQWQFIKQKNFTWDCNANITIPQNRILSYPNISQSGYVGRSPLGSSLTSKYMYHYQGVNPETGIYTFKDLDKNGSLDQNDKSPVFIGQKYFGGIENTLTYKAFSLNMLFQFVNQRGPGLTGNVTPGRYGPSGGNQYARYADRWQQPGDQAFSQKYSTIDNIANNANIAYSQSDAQIVNTSFIRLKNVTLSLTLPKYWTDRYRIQSSRIFMQGQNILTISGYDGLDPESAQYGSNLSLPPLRVITVGIQIVL